MPLRHDDRERKKGASEMLVLALLEDGDRHGYEIARRIGGAQALGTARHSLTRCSTARRVGYDRRGARNLEKAGQQHSTFL